MMRKNIYLGLVVSAVFLYLAVRKIDLDGMLRALAAANYWYLIPAVLLTMLGFVIRSVRWRLLLGPVKRIGIHPLFSATMIGFMANNVLPARLGEFVRAYAIGKTQGISKSSAFATIVVERIFDIFGLMLFMGVTVSSVNFPRRIRSAGVGVLILNIAVLVLLYFVEARPGFLDRLVSVVTRVLPERGRIRLQGWIEAFARGLAVLRSVWQIAAVLGLSILMWGVVSFAVHFCIVSFHLDVPFHAAIILLVIISIGIMLPSSPAYIGTLQFFSVLGLAVFKVPKTDALSFSFLYHASQFFPVTLAGFFYLWRENISLSQISREGQKALEETPGT